MTAVVAGVGAPAQAAAPPRNVGWLYVEGGGGAAFFDADLEGHPGWEKITVCDNASNRRGVGVHVYGDLGQDEGIVDPSNDGRCVSIEGNMFPDGYGVDVHVYEYAGDSTYGWTDGRGVA